MRNTIKAKEGYIIRSKLSTKTNVKLRYLFDGSNLVMIAYDMPYEIHKEELKENEMYHICEIFETVKGNKFIYTRDEEIDIDYLVKVGEQQ